MTALLIAEFRRENQRWLNSDASLRDELIHAVQELDPKPISALLDPRLLGRGRALEVLLTAHELNGDLAELYGYVNRSLPDALLDDFVDRPAQRIASFRQGSHHGNKTAGGHRESPARFGNRARMGSLHEVVGASSNSGTHKEIDGSRLPPAWGR